MQIDTENKEKEVVPSKEQDKGKDEVPPSEVTPVQVTPVQSPGMDDDVPEVPPPLASAGTMATTMRWEGQPPSAW